MARTQTQTYYEILEVPQTSSHQEIVAAYERAKTAYAPDSPALYSMFSKDEAEELRKMIEEAYLILGSEAKRKEYDQVLLSRMEHSIETQLPDFAPRESSKTPATTQSAAPVPDGFAKSRLSVYEKNEKIESEIKSVQQIDGAFLRKIRQYKNINVEQMSKETRISRSYLLAIESEDLDALPAPVFLRGFITQYARLLGLDETVAVTSYMDKVKKR